MASTLPDEVCCPPLDIDRWDGQSHEWENKLFVKTRVRCFLYIPINYGSKIRKVVHRTDAAGVAIPEGLILSDQTSPWRMDLYFAVERGVPGIQNTTLSGQMVSKVYEAPYKEAGRCHKQFVQWMDRRGSIPQRLFTWYATCPACAKKQGKNLMVYLALT